MADPVEQSTSKLRITLATTNVGKQQELMNWVFSGQAPVQLILNPDAPDIEETGSTFLENARLKASQSPPVDNCDLILAEDSGMTVAALDGYVDISPFPGIYSNRWLTRTLREQILGASLPNRMPLDRIAHDGVTNTDLCQAIMTLMQDKTDRMASYCCGMVLWHREKGLLFETMASTPLAIITGEARGMNGFGYDPITVPLEASVNQDSADLKTMAELSNNEKNQISHRGKAFAAVLAFLKAEGYLPAAG